MNATTRPRLLVLIVAYNAETTIQRVLHRIPARLLEGFDVEVLVIDDGSTDRTFDRGEDVRREASLPFTLTVLANPVNQGYGGNQKIGFHYAIEHGFDVVALIHGDGQYAPESLPDLIAPLAAGEADAVFGSRMLHPGEARRGGMPLYKYVGNRILTAIQNRLLHARLSEFHSGYRLYATAALRRIPFHLNDNGFRFDTDIIIQLLVARARIRELPIPTYYGDEICRVNGIAYAGEVVAASLRARAQQWSVFYDRKLDVGPAVRPGEDQDAGRTFGAGNDQYEPKLTFSSTHTLALEHVPPGSRVLDVGGASGFLTEALRARGCRTTGVDAVAPSDAAAFDAFHLYDLDAEEFPLDLREFDCVLLLDVVEHLQSPERFVDGFARAAALNPNLTIVASTGNVAFVVVRLMLLLGQFNYGKRGILDLTHTRLFTFGTFRRLFEQAGFTVVSMSGVPAPFPLALGERPAARLLLGLNRALVRVSRSLFAFQMLAVVRPRPSLAYLLERARSASVERSAGRAG